MSKAEGKKIAIKFTLPIGPLALTPTVVADTEYSTPVGTVTYSNQYSTSYPASAAFDGDTGSYWQTRATLPQWNMVELAEARGIAGFRLYSGSSYRPNAVDLYGSNDGVNFDLIHQTINANSTGWKTYAFTPTIPYKYYKWEVKSTYTAGRVYVYELQLLFCNIVDKSGNESAFSISGQEYLWTDGPDNNGPVVNKTYLVDTVQSHPTEDNSIQLIMRDSIRNANGQITISYNQALGNLSGAGGAVGSFTEAFTPSELEQGLINSGYKAGTHEHIEVSVEGEINFIYIAKLRGYAPPEYITASIDGTIELIHKDIINP